MTRRLVGCIRVRCARLRPEYSLRPNHRKLGYNAYDQRLLPATPARHRRRACRQRYYAPALRRNRRFGVSGVVDPSPQRRMWAAGQMGAPVFASPPAEAFAAASYDAALVLAPPRFQPDVLRDVLSHGLPVLTEKPGARTAAEASSILETAQGLTVRVALARRYWRGYQAIRTAYWRTACSLACRHCHGPIRLGPPRSVSV